MNRYAEVLLRMVEERRRALEEERRLRREEERKLRMEERAMAEENGGKGRKGDVIPSNIGVDGEEGHPLDDEEQEKEEEEEEEIPPATEEEMQHIRQEAFLEVPPSRPSYGHPVPVQVLSPTLGACVIDGCWPVIEDEEGEKLESLMRACRRLPEVAVVSEGYCLLPPSAW